MALAREWWCAALVLGSGLSACEGRETTSATRGDTYFAPTPALTAPPASPPSDIGVTEDILAEYTLDTQGLVDWDQRILRLRETTQAGPGSQVHAHADRPAITFITDGAAQRVARGLRPSGEFDITENRRNACVEAADAGYRCADGGVDGSRGINSNNAVVETTNIVHSLNNNLLVTARFLVFDLYNPRNSEELGQRPLAEFPLRFIDGGSLRIGTMRFRMRRLTLQPGAVLASHDHRDRPGITHVVDERIAPVANAEGLPEQEIALLEYVDGGPLRGYVREHKLGSTMLDGVDLRHWLKNVSASAVTLISVDLL